MNFSKYNESIWNSLGEKNNKKTKKMAHVLHGPSKKNSCLGIHVRVGFIFPQHSTIYGRKQKSLRYQHG